MPKKIVAAAAITATKRTSGCRPPLVGALWASGCAWLILDQFFAGRGAFGATPHPLQAPLLLLHGVLSVLSMYLFGWITARLGLSRPSSR